MTSTAATRLDSLRRLADVVERSAPTPERNAVLMDIRARIVSVSGGQYAPSAWNGEPVEGEVHAGPIRFLPFRG